MSAFLAQPLGSKVVIAQTKSSRLQGFKQTGICCYLLDIVVSFLSNIFFLCFPLALPQYHNCFDILNGQKLCIFLSLKNLNKIHDE